MTKLEQAYKLIDKRGHLQGEVCRIFGENCGNCPLLFEKICNNSVTTWKCVYNKVGNDSITLLPEIRKMMRKDKLKKLLDK